MLAALVATGALLLVAGCGGDSKTATEILEPDSSTAPTASSGAASEEQPANGDHLTIKTLIPALRAALAKGDATAHFSLDITGLLQARGVMDMNAEKPTMDMISSASASGGQVRLILVDGVIYAALPNLPKGKYVMSDPDDPDDPLMKSLGAITEAAAVNSQFRVWKAALTDVSFVGSDRLDGADTAHYKLTMNFAKIAKAQGQQMVPGAPKSVSYHLWVDGDDRMRKMTFEMSGISLDMSWSDWGEPIQVMAPPASKIITK
jgi:hypothetical protein